MNVSHPYKMSNLYSGFTFGEATKREVFLPSHLTLSHPTDGNDSTFLSTGVLEHVHTWIRMKIRRRYHIGRREGTNIT